MNETSLKKFLLSILKDEYPKIKGIRISSTDMGHVILYRVGIGLKKIFNLNQESKNYQNIFWITRV